MPFGDASGSADAAHVLLEWVSTFTASSQANSVCGVADWLQNNTTSDE